MSLSVGLDVGSLHVRAVAIRRGRGDDVSVVAHASVPRRDGDGIERSLATVIAELAAAIPLAAPVACAASELEVLARFITVAPLPPARLARLLRLELAPDDGQPVPAMDAVRLAVGGDDLAFLGLIADAGAVKLLLGELARGGVRPQAVSWGPVALAAAAHRLQLDEDQLALVVDIGVGGCDVALVGAGRVLACRRLGVGGDLFTQALAETGLTPAAAEKSKLAGDYARSVAVPAPPTSALADAGDGGLAKLDLDLGLDDVAEAVSPPNSPDQPSLPLPGQSLAPQLTRAAETLYGQLSTTTAFFKAQLKIQTLNVSRVFLCGGGAGLAGLDEYLTRRFQIPVERWDPLAGLTGQIPEAPHCWARALGLALASPEVPHADLRPEATLRRELWVRQLVWPWVAAACLLAAGVLAALCLSERVERDRREAELLERAVKEHESLSKELRQLETDRDALGEDLRAIAGRIYASRDLLMTVQALKELTTTNKALWVTVLETSKDDRELTSGGEAPADTGGKRPLGKAAPARVDTLISRGAVDIVGQIRFEARKKDPEMWSYLERYQQALRDWTTAEGWKLFRDVRLQKGVPERLKKGRGVAAEEGEFPFTYRCYYPPTRLDAGLVQAVEAAPEAKPEPKP